ncbi:MAG: thioesterase family protein [Planctomycetota bacterium]
MEEKPLLAGFPVIVPISIAWGEMDAFGHVNNIIYFRYFECSRIAYFEKIRIMEYMKETQIGPILKETSCRFRIPLTYPGTIQVGCRVKEILEYGFLQEHRILVFQENTWKIAAEGEGNIVSYHYEKRQKVKLPEEIQQRIKNVEFKGAFP